ncbi:MAG: ABC transporter permease, partial [Planctomycetota bacterium]
RLDTREVTNYAQLEQSSILPVDYEASSGKSTGTYRQAETTRLEDLPEVESAQFVTFGASRVAICSAELAKQLGGRVCSMNVFPLGDADVEQVAERVATVTRLPTYLGARGEVTRLFFTSLTEASGWRDLIIPVVLGGLIIFATMLGSVSDREKEIYAFSALGLAPPHVAGLFFAEACVYAVVGGMGGYLLGQVVSRGMNAVAAMRWFGEFDPPRMNYSSTNAIVTVLAVMCTVLISTIYPAVKASRSANPGIQRSWRIGKPVGDLHDIVFPFTVSAYDITGVVSFLREHFQNFSDTALGVFATASVHVFKQGDDKLGMQAQVALAPFDLGVSQKFALMAQPSEIEGIEEIRILLRRASGTRGDWQRANRVFINELRKQLLIWRSLQPEIMERYRQMTLSQWKQLPVEDVTPATFGETR